MDAYELTQLTAARLNVRSEAAPNPWIQSARFDLLFFILSPLIAIPLLILSPAGPSMLALVAASFLGFPHYLSTFVFYFWDETRPVHRAHRALFFGGPVVIVASLAFAAVFRVPLIIQVVVFVWNTFHVSRQSCGIHSIYRHRAGVKDPSLKSVVNSAIMSTSVAMAFWNIAWYPTMHRFLTIFWSGLPELIAVTTAATAGVALVRLGLSLVHRFRSDNPPQLPELAFLTTSLLLFHPYLWVRDSNRATLAMLLGHFVQYLGIVWLVHRRKFGALQGPATQTWLARLSTNLPLLILAVLASGSIFFALQLLSDRTAILRATYEGTYLMLALVHFYLDGLFWAFRRPEVRQTLGPYLLGKRPVAVAAQP